MILNSIVFESFLKCPTKAWLKYKGESGQNNTYFNWLENQQKTFDTIASKKIELLFSTNRNSLKKSSPKKQNIANRDLHLNYLAKSESYETVIQAFEGTFNKRSSKHSDIIVFRFIYRNKISRIDKLLIAFDTLALSEALHCKSDYSQLIHGDNLIIRKVNTSVLMPEVRKHIRQLNSLLLSESPPPLFLNRHCQECEFEAGCKQTALEKDDLSLLGGLKEKECKKYQSRGIVTISQLAHIFRPRRRSKNRLHIEEKYHHALKAKSIKEGRIHVVGNPKLELKGVPVFLDVEGVPDKDFYYLIGMRVKLPGKSYQSSFWANTINEEHEIWNEFKACILKIDNPVIIYYGSYESIFFNRMLLRYENLSENYNRLKQLLENSINILAFMYAKIYFPTYSNGLKEICSTLGFSWTDPKASGVMSLQWRSQWDLQSCIYSKKSLIKYNAEDCEAAEKLTATLLMICSNGKNIGCNSTKFNVVNTADIEDEKFFRFNNNEFATPELDRINKAAYWDYQRLHVIDKNNKTVKTKKTTTLKPKLHINKHITIEKPVSCSKCGSNKLYTHAYRNRVIYDIRITKYAIKTWTVKYTCIRYMCSACNTVSDSCRDFLSGSKYGKTLIAFCLYQSIEMRLSAGMSHKLLNEMFSLYLPKVTFGNFRASAAEIYQNSYMSLIYDITHGNLVHVDETKVHVRGGSHYIWVFTSLKHVFYVFSKTREADLVHEYLKNFKGVLVTDFYAAYDSLNCPQQKCLIHLIRDLNDDLLKEPFNQEISNIGTDFTAIMSEIIATIDRFGLKHRFLKRHKNNARKFISSVINKTYFTESALKWQRRLQKNKDKLFTFLDYDGVPWNNNNAEHAIKAVALLRNAIGGSSTEKGIKNYMVLLSISETCKCNNLSFLDFLLSDIADISEYSKTKNSSRDKIP